jgi:Ca2+:H+ antiporter
MMSQLLFVTVTALILPTASFLLSKTAVSIINEQSRGVAVILIIVYILYLTFEFVTHKTLFQIESEKVAVRPRKHRLPDGAVLKGLAAAGGVVAAQGRSSHIWYDNYPNDDIMQRDG